MSRRCCLAVVVMVSLLMRAQSAFAQQQPVDVRALQKQYEAYQQHQADLDMIARDKPGVVRAITAAWTGYATNQGFGDGWETELEQVLMTLPPEKLLAVRQAKTYDELVDMALGQRRAASVPSGDLVADLSAPMLIGSDATDLVYFPVTPCRLIDTRNAGGKLTANTSRNFYVNGSLTAQGGNPAGCGLPADPAAVALSIIATEEQGAGDLRAYRYLDSAPIASVLNFREGIDIGATTVVPQCQMCGPDITILADVATTHVVADVVGYFWSPNATALDGYTVQTILGVGAGNVWDYDSGSCPSGYTLVGGGYNYTNAIFNVYFYQAGPNAAGTGWRTRGLNNSGIGINVTTTARCARVPGR